MVKAACLLVLALGAAGAARFADAASANTAPRPALPENLALKATATATSEYSDQYLARFAIDGKIPDPGGQSDLSAAWCVQGNTHRNGAELTLTWPAPVTIAEVVYYGRTAWFAEECWKDYEVTLDGAAQPAVKGQLEQGHGPQRIRLPQPAQAKKLTLKFTSSYGGLNPGASEVQVFATPPAEGALPKFYKLPNGTPQIMVEEPVQQSPELAAKAAAGKLGFDTLLVVQRRELNPTHVYTYHVEGFGAGGGLYTLSLANGALKELVASPQGQILDSDVSFDGKEILFSWRKAADQGYHVYRINADGTGLTQLTDGAWHDYNATWLPDGGIAFLSTRSARFAYCWISPVGLLHRMERDGSKVRRLSANIVNDFTPSVMPDGRIIYSRWEYVDRPAIPIQSLWTINPDGTGLAGFYGNRVLSPATFMDEHPIPGTNKVLCTLTSHNGPARGAVGVIDPVYGDNAQESLQNITPEVRVGKVGQGDGNNVKGPYETPYPLNRQYYLVSKRGSVVIRDYAGSEEACLLRPAGPLGFYSAKPIRAHPRPPVVPSALPQKGGEWATVVLQDVYNGLEPYVKRGEIKEICVVQEMEKGVRTDVNHRAFGFQFPVISCGATYACKKVWGYAPVAPDGSACFQVPAGVPIYFMALDANGRALQRMRTFTHLMPGEKQGCIGCHEPRNTVSAPRRMLADVTHPDALRPPDWGDRVGFDYSTVVQPVLDRYCVSCHSGPNPPKKVDLCGDKTDFFNVSYEALARGRQGGGAYDNPYTSWIPTYNGMEQNILQITPLAWGSPKSKLADILLNGHPDSAGKPRVAMDAAGRKRIFQWIDLNVPYYGTSETAYPDNEGCRRMVPPALEATLAGVAKRRCASCHAGGIPRQVWTRITNPQRNDFLMAPLAVAAGGSGACGKPVFESVNDPDYQAILKTFDPILAMLAVRPRMDMPGAQPAPNVCRLCQ